MNFHRAMLLYSSRFLDNKNILKNVSLTGSFREIWKTSYDHKIISPTGPNGLESLGSHLRLSGCCTFVVFPCCAMHG